jgi:Cd2+/Zn2+-exporting ATPase
VCELHTESIYHVEGLDCHDEVRLLERRLGGLPGLEAMTADILNQRLRVAHDAARLSAAEVAEAVNATGMRAWLEHERPSRVSSETSSGRLRLVLVSGAAAAAGFALQAAGAGRALVVPAYLGAIVAGGVHTARRAWLAGRALVLDINVLMLVAVAGAIAIGAWSEAAVVAFLFATAQWLETRSMDRARHAIRALMELVPAEALVRRDGADRLVRVEDLSVGDTVVIRPGEKIPVDGQIIEGASDVNQAPITGESLPAPRRAGDEVLAGTINGHGALVVSVTRRPQDTTMARIIDLVETAQTRRAPSQSSIERFARMYTPAVVLGAIVVALVPPLALGARFVDWFYRALVLLVISCPCALVISTPVSFVSALSGAARRGVLIKGGMYLERVAAVRVVAFDKTGTLTRGRLQVVQIDPFPGVDRSEVLRLAAAVEARSEHPIARAVVSAAATEGVLMEPAGSVRALPGFGVEGQLSGVKILVGNYRLFESRGLSSPEVEARVSELGGTELTAVLVAREDRPVGIIAVADLARASARSVVDRLRRAGVAHVVMLTGDSRHIAAAVAADLGITEWRAELLPAEKVRAIEDLRRRYGTVAMVGDGVNDAPALAAADVGIAMGAAGSDATLETADVALMADDVLAVPELVRLGRKTVLNVRVNIAVAVGLKAIFLGLAALGLATLWMAVAADMGASLLVIANGLRLLRQDPGFALSGQ